MAGKGPYANMEGIRPKRIYRQGTLAEGDRQQDIEAWQRHLDHGRSRVAQECDRLASGIDQLQEEFVTSGSAALSLDDLVVMTVDRGAVTVGLPITEREAEYLCDWNSNDGVQAKGKGKGKPKFNGKGKGDRKGKGMSPQEISGGRIDFHNLEGKGRFEGAKGKAKGKVHTKGWSDDVLYYEYEVDLAQRHAGIRRSYRDGLPEAGKSGKGCGKLNSSRDDSLLQMMDENWEGYRDHPILNSVRRTLFPGLHQSLDAGLEELLICQPGNSRQWRSKSVRTVTTGRHVGSLLLFLPAVQGTGSGDHVAVRHGEREELVKLDGFQEGELGWVAFLADCDYQVEPPVSGHRLVLLYKLSVNQDAQIPQDFQILQAVRDDTSTAIVEKLSELLWNRELPRRPLGILLKHQYPLRSCRDLAALKGTDQRIAEMLRTLNLRFKMQPVILEARWDWDWPFEGPHFRVFHAAAKPLEFGIRHDCMCRLTSNWCAGHRQTTIIQQIEAFLYGNIGPEDISHMTPSGDARLPMSVTWVNPVKNPVGQSLMEDAIYRRNRWGDLQEVFRHYFHSAIIISTQSSQHIFNTPWQVLPPTRRLELALQAGNADAVLTQFYSDAAESQRLRATVLGAQQGNLQMLVQTLSVDLLRDHQEELLMSVVRGGNLECLEVLMLRSRYSPDLLTAAAALAVDLQQAQLLPRLLHAGAVGIEPRLSCLPPAVQQRLLDALLEAGYPNSFAALKVLMQSMQSRLSVAQEQVATLQARRWEQQHHIRVLVQSSKRMASELQLAVPLIGREFRIRKEVHRLQDWLLKPPPSRQPYIYRRCVRAPAKRTRLAQLDRILGLECFWVKSPRHKADPEPWFHLERQVRAAHPPQLEAPGQWMCRTMSTGERQWFNVTTRTTQREKPAAWRLMHAPDDCSCIRCIREETRPVREETRPVREEMFPDAWGAWR